ncbi:cysteine hydrolase family protein [Clostridium cellulovorans]|uniref:Isochorismatase hydrolase n=1 Tax=Clostridium cellulovorans (strain ATCC 35296 / DSM 3052 / OCM 3 / 743B) TaxID=573061 RepID=D9SVU9_CLOC7|nr:isochorismatase family cysteine hydrolase [Clostridium cellulovorans]ADL53160.1 isochorismatase hydrolase [Clostridium cellulovorans 743B]
MKNLLVVVDFQKDFVDGTLGFKKAVTLEIPLYDKINNYLKNGDKVVFTYDTHSEDYLQTREGKNLPIVHCIDGTEGHQLYGKIKEFQNVENTFHYKKGSFGMSPEDVLRLSNELGKDIDNIEIVGIVTNMCVISNVVTFQSQYTNVNISVDGSLCASFDDKLHEKALDVIEALQVKVTNR